MAVSIQQVGNDTIYIRSGAPDYFAVIDTSLAIKPVVDIRYSGITYRVKNKIIIEPAYTHPLFGRIDQVNPVRTDLEVFLLTLYFGDFFLGYDQYQNDFDSDLVESNLTGEYDSINIVDFSVMTGSKERNYRKPDNTVQDILQLGPTDARPAMDEVDDTEQGNGLMIDIIKYRGLKGFIPHLFAKKAISFSDLVEIVEHFYPIIENPENLEPLQEIQTSQIKKRMEYYATSLGPSLKTKQAPLFNSLQLKTLKLL